MVLTATATQTSKQQILQTLNLPLKDVVFIQESPYRSNLVNLKQLLDNNDPLEKGFGGLIDDMLKKGKDTPRTLFQTRKQCSIFFSNV